MNWRVLRANDWACSLNIHSKAGFRKRENRPSDYKSHVPVNPSNVPLCGALYITNLE